MKHRVLIVDDEPDIRELLEITLGRMSLTTSSAENLESARHLLSTQSFSLCLTDMHLPDGDGLELVEYIQKKYNQTPVAVITAHGTTETAIKALKTGAFDFVSKPVDLQKLRDLVNSALRLPQTRMSEDSSRSETTFPGPSITGQSPRVKELREQIAKLARSQAPIYISGESGSGKELAARAIHQQSSRSTAPFIAVNCGAISKDLVESELFGHLKGSFTGADQDKQGLFQAAHGGTLFLDEIADLPLHTQVKLLRVIQEKAIRSVGSQHEEAVDVRILSATHKSLIKEVENGNLRQDLYFRINVIELSVPSLRNRKEDIPELTVHILQKIADENDTDVCQLSDDALLALQDYRFPGNVRELENILQRAATMCEENIIQESNLDFISAPAPVSPTPTSEQAEITPKIAETTIDISDDFSLEKHLEAIEIEAIEKALEETRWNKTAAAKKLGMTFRSLRYRLKKLGLD
ncbi:MAG: sigma-54-dependent Fis family transcriptional regulator [SAR86 cluster bacterium]|uniref:Sigma-54-dependent Fis family transcriptional regulator n=1 Tax=SAR86 cluster bacterium TaxID=2030880 RepID=A0A2A5AEN6_9GAMM|nr:MAG: sigma-54-dependent Fis family transcriptional regulator [SAR86 cluster bacterium]